MTRPDLTRRANTSRGQWPVLLLLVVAVVTPTACVLWFMVQAMSNERLAVRQRLQNAYMPRIERVSQKVEAFWQARARELTGLDPKVPAVESFARLVTNGTADSLTFYDPQDRPEYPAFESVISSIEEKTGSDWLKAVQLEEAEHDDIHAAELYARIARESSEADLAARALQAQARCLARIGKIDAALDVTRHVMAEPNYRATRDPIGRLIVPNMQLFALTLPRDRLVPEWTQLAAELRARLMDYSLPVMPASQRLFLMIELRRLEPGLAPLPTFEAETLAAQFLDRGGRPAVPGVLVRSAMSGVWQWTSPNQRVVALFREDQLIDRMEQLAASEGNATDAVTEIRPATVLPARQEPLLETWAGAILPDWRIALRLTGPDPFSNAAERRIAVYLWTGILAMGTVAALALLLVRYLSRQVRLTRLKNDLIATVSHELKTPLASIRLLTETLLDGKTHDASKTREYLSLIARENLRLSSLIDNFLTFSRMERNKRTFDLRAINAGEVAAAAVEAVRERFASDRFQLEVQVPGDLPAVLGDRDALTTVLVNLLDNARKYSQNDKRVCLRARCEGDWILFEVIDHGVGIARRDLRRIFEKFYQADHSLSREAGGVGLGLSIVKFIIDAHHGTIDVSSGLGRGSTFTVRMPVMKTQTSAPPQGRP
ncbi:MAG TPA: HAMP domain-containing sensor histidine kinase [Phycisphaerae bacterium]|nr:HAMP domain-containing sensor histidine kinase [Phycisphaerae bacterium]